MSVTAIIALALVMILPWGEGGATPTALAVIHTLAFLAAAAALLDARRRGELDVRLPWPLLAFLPFLLVGGLSFARSTYLFGAFETYWDQIIALTLCLALLVSRRSTGFARLSSAVVVISAVVQAAPAIATRLLGGVAVSPSFLNPNHLAAYLNVATLVALARSGHPLVGSSGAVSTKSRRLWLLAALLCTAGTLAIGSRGALIALVATLVYALSTSGFRALRRALPAVAVLVLLAVLSVVLRFTTVVDPYRYDRPRLWATAVAVWREAPLLGIGPGMYKHSAVRHNFPQEEATFRYSKEPHSAHSEPLQILAEEGAVGLASFLLFAGTAWIALGAAGRRPGERGVEGRAMGLAAVAVGIHSLFETPFEAPAIPLTLLILAWPALDPGGIADAAASFRLKWSVDPKGRRDRLRRWAIASSVVTIGAVLYLAGVVAPYLSDLAVRYAEAPTTTPPRIEAAMRLAERMNPWQPFLGYRRARAAMARTEHLSPTLLSNALESFEKAIRLAPEDPSAYALMGRLYARAVADLPGAGPGAADAADRFYSEAIERSPLDARLWLERGGFRLLRGATDGALADSREALRLEPSALAARQLELEVLIVSGNARGAAAALERLDHENARLRGYEPINGYESFLMRLNGHDLEKARGMISALLFLVPDGGALGGGHGGDGRRRLLGEDQIEQRLLDLGIPSGLAVAVVVPVHACLADGRLNLALGQSLDGVIQNQLAPWTVVFDGGTEAHGPLDHWFTPGKPTLYRVWMRARRWGGEAVVRLRTRTRKSLGGRSSHRRAGDPSDLPRSRRGPSDLR